MRYRLFTYLAVVCAIGVTRAQNKSLGVGIASPNPNAALHVESPTNNQGFILPRLTTAQRTSISPLTSADAGLIVYDSDLKSVFIWSGSNWEPGSKPNYPSVDTIASAPNNSNLLRLIYAGSAVENVGVAQFSNLNPNNGFNTLFVTSAGLNGAGYFQVTNNNSLSPALRGITNSNQPTVHGVAGRTTGLGGSGGYFEVLNAASTQPALIGVTNGSGGSAYFENTSTSGAIAGLTSRINTNTSGTAIDGQSFGQAGHGGSFITTNPSNASPTVNSISQGTGAAISLTNSGTGRGAEIFIQNAANTANGLYVENQGGGNTAHFTSLNAGNPFATIVSFNSGTGNAVSAINNGMGPAGRFNVTQASNTSASLTATTVGTGPAIFASNTGSGNGFAGHFTVTNPTNGFQALKAYTQGTGSAATFEILNAANSGSALDVGTTGTGSAIFAQVNNAANTSPALNVETNGANGGSYGIRSYTTGLSNAGYFETNNTSAVASTLAAVTNSTSGGRALTAINNGTGIAGSFTITNATSAARALNISTNGTGEAIWANHVGASGDIAVFQSSSVNVARIDKTGKGFFNGGTQASGADVAEMFDIEGFRNEYEPGDVLVISERTDRTVEKSNSPGSTKVAGVYATKPGLILTERDIEENLDQLVPMGVVGVIPTKVCLENGPIKRGDLLVTSSKAGHAMKALPQVIGGVEIYPTGAILGKALENFEAADGGLIKVLVNVK